MLLLIILLPSDEASDDPIDTNKSSILRVDYFARASG